MINQVTITGADNSIDPSDLLTLAAEFPFVEWGILLSATKEGNPRFPTKDWIEKLALLAKSHNLNLAGHICGSWVRRLVTQSDPAVFNERPEFLEYFPRIQLNFSPYDAAHRFLSLLQPHSNQFIVQVGKSGLANKHTLLQLGGSMGLNLAMLFDRSGGKGVVPSSWPAPFEPIYTGYAGGLGPETLEDQLPLILQAAGDRSIWIDMERRIRSDDDVQFDLGKVRACLEIRQLYISP
jgi:hypothetical protein